MPHVPHGNSCPGPPLVARTLQVVPCLTTRWDRYKVCTSGYRHWSPNGRSFSNYPITHTLIHKVDTRLIARTIYTRLPEPYTQGCQIFIHKVARTLYTRLPDIYTQGCHNLIHKVATTLYTRLPEPYIQGCHNLIYKVATTL